MFINNFNPVAISIFSFDIRWYSLAYIVGILIGWIYCKKILIKDVNISKDFDDFLTYLIIGIIVGGRLGYVLIYNLSYYLNNPIEIVMIWNGGMSFHGAVMGVIFFNYFFVKKKNLESFIFLDLVALTAPIGIFLGRIANFINSELYGRTTEIFLSVIFEKIDNFPRHPSQIYEAIFEGIILFMILNFTFKKYHNKNGLISSLFLIYYSLFRFFIEFTREPDQHIGFIFLNLTMGQIFSLVFLITGALLFYVKNDTK